MIDNLFNQFRAPLDLAGRILLALIFLASGFGKIGDWSQTRREGATARNETTT